jgi:hypothetical protein
MKTILFLILMFPVGVCGWSQEATAPAAATASRNMEFGLTVSYSVAVGHYAGFDKENSRSGYAGNGYAIGLSYVLMGKRNFGLGLGYNYQNNPLADTARNIKADGKDFPLGTGAWNNHYLLIGPVFMKDFRKWVLDVRFLVGGMISFSPVFNTMDPFTREIDKNMAAGFAMQFSVGFGYRISPHWTVMAQVAYLGATAIKNKDYQFLAIDTIWDASHQQIIRIDYSTMVNETEMKKPVSSFSTGIGIKYNF